MTPAELQKEIEAALLALEPVENAETGMTLIKETVQAIVAKHNEPLTYDVKFRIDGMHIGIDIFEIDDRRFAEDECIKEFLDCLTVGELATMLFPRLTERERMEILAEQQAEYDEERRYP